jgi:hypothetical protein
MVRTLIRALIDRILGWLGYEIAVEGDEYEVQHVDGRAYWLVCRFDASLTAFVDGKMYVDGDILRDCETDEYLVRRVRPASEGTDVVIQYERVP